MRNFILLLILSNLVYLAWNARMFFGEKNEAVVNVAVIQGQAGQSLQLLSELEPGELIQHEVLKEELPESQIKESVTVSDAEIDLVDEIGSEKVFVSPIIELADLADGIPQCLTVGAFPNDEESDEVLLELVELGYTPKVIITEVKTSSDYWVHMPPFNSLAAARLRLGELQEKNIDSYIITEAEGELAQGISLGLFGEMARALVLQSTIAEQGYPSSIYEVERSSRQVWLEFKDLTAPELSTIRALESINGQSGLKLEEKLCETIAPEG